MSSAEENKVLVRRFLEAQANADPDALEELLAPDFVDHSLQPDQEPGREGFIRSVAEEPAIFSDLRVNIYDQVAEGDKVTTRFTWRRIHDRGEFLGIGAYRDGDHDDRHRHQPRIRGQDRRGVERKHGCSGGDAPTSGAREARARARRAGATASPTAFSKPHCPKRCPPSRAGNINPHYHPAREVGGDFYDFHLLPEERLGVVVGDATGKGVPAALVMASARSMLRALAQASNSPGEVLRRVNDALSQQTSPPTCSSPASTPSSTPSTAPWSYANAGHDLPYLWRGGDADELRATGMPLGLMPGMSYEQKEIGLDCGQGVVLLQRWSGRGSRSQG